MAKQTIYIYSDRTPYSLDINSLAEFLRKMGFSVEYSGDFFDNFPIKGRELASRLVKCRVLDPTKKDSLNELVDEDAVEEELGILNSQEPLKLKKDLSNLYEAYALSSLMLSYLKKGCQIVFTSRMFATFEGSRYHGRTIFVHLPFAIISTSGLVEAPAKPREYYLKYTAYQRAKNTGLRVPEEEDFLSELNDEFRDRFIDYNDSRLPEVLKGYALQAAFYMFFGEAFCDSTDCRLYNAHTQEEMIHSQIKVGKLCEKHNRMLQNFL
jgi:hypothetical protein